MYVTQFYSNNDRHLQILSKGAQIVIYSLRNWHLSVIKKKNPRFQIYEFYRRYNLASSATLFDQMIQYSTAESFKIIQVDHVNHPRLNSDEQTFLKCLMYIEALDEAKAVQVIGQFVDESLIFTFLNVARDYVKTLVDEGYSLNTNESTKNTVTKNVNIKMVTSTIRQTLIRAQEESRL